MRGKRWVTRFLSYPRRGFPVLFLLAAEQLRLSLIVVACFNLQHHPNYTPLFSLSLSL